MSCSRVSVLVNVGCSRVQSAMFSFFFVCCVYFFFFFLLYFFFQAEDGIRDLVRSRGLGDVYKRQSLQVPKLELYKVKIWCCRDNSIFKYCPNNPLPPVIRIFILLLICLLYTSDAADERSSVDLGGRRIIKKKKVKKEEKKKSKKKKTKQTIGDTIDI